MSADFEIYGHCEPRFAGVRDAFEKNFEQGLETGASFAAVLDGEMVVDLWGGFADAAATRAWQEDTLINVYSTTKAMCALCVLMLVDRGELDLDAPVASVWPEFAAAGKDHLPVRYLLSHTSGLAGWQERVTIDDILDWDRATSLLAAQEPWWEPGKQSGYHALTQGFLLGEVVRRVTGRSLGTFYREEVAEPLGVDFHIGLGQEHEPRVAEMIPPEGTLGSGAGLEPGSVASRVLGNPMMSGGVANRREWRAAEIPAANGQGNARAVARVAGVLARGGEQDGVRLLGADTLGKVIEEQCYSKDLVLSLPIRWGLGFGLASKEIPISVNERVFFWGGWGGSLVVVDLDAKLGFSYVMNRMSAGTMGDPRGFGPALALMGALAS